MKRINFLIIFLLLSLSMVAKDDIKIYIGSANRYASINLPDYRKRLCKRYRIRPYNLEKYFQKCGHDWGNVGLALEIAHVTGKRLEEVCEYYSKYRHHGWNYILHKMGVCHGTHYYDMFYNHLCDYRKSWDDCYESHHRYSKYHRRHCKKLKWYDDDDDDDDDDD